MLFPDVITAKTPGAMKLAVLDEQGQDLTKTMNIDTIDVPNGVGVIIVKRGKKYYRRPHVFGKITLKLKL